MKTRKLLLLVAGFMLFAFAAKAQHTGVSEEYGFRVDNQLAETIYVAVGGAYYSTGGSKYSFERGQKYINPGDFLEYKENAAGIAEIPEAYIKITTQDNHVITAYRNSLESNGEQTFYLPNRTIKVKLERPTLLFWDFTIQYE